MGIYVDKYSKLWSHTVMRIRNAEKDCSKDGVLDYEKFKKKMITRLNRIEKLEKVHYAISALIQIGYKEIAEIYDSRLVMEILVNN